MRRLISGATAALLIAACGDSKEESGLCLGEAPARSSGASADLSCLYLTPAPNLPASLSGVVELAHPGGPFTAAVNARGNQVHAPTLHLAGLPDPAALGAYTVYVAWLTTELYSPFINLGAVSNGANALPLIDLDKFVVVVSAEPADSVSERTGRLVLRGGSPSTRMQPPDVLDFTVGSMLDAGIDTHTDHGSHSHVAVGSEGGGGAGSAGGSAEWPMVPMPEGLAMFPAEMALRPAVAPFLPAAVPGVEPREVRRAGVVELAHGDTLRLEATLAQRTIHGRRYTVYAYNGEWPGPVIAVHRDAEVVVRFVNRIDQPSTIHWHGVRLDHRFDGVPHLSQSPVAPGDSFTYLVRFPDAGVYWYHSHVREDIQQDLGLYGNMMVRGDTTLPPVHREELLLVDDILIGEAGLIPYGATHTTHALMGRFGNVLLVNGSPAWSGSARVGEVVRFWFTNAANTRTFNLSVPHARMKLVATDLGPFTSDEWVESVVLAPAERYAVDIRFDSAGEFALVNQVRAIDHVFGEFFSEVDTLGVVKVQGAVQSDGIGASYDSLMKRAALASEIERAVAGAVRLRPRVLEFGLRTSNLPFYTSWMMLLDSAYFNPVEWSGTMPVMNWATTGAQAHWFVRDPRDGSVNDSVTLKVREGERMVLRLVNLRNSLHAMQHPVHVHGQRFLVLAVNGVSPRTRGWKDTVLLPAGAAVDILVEFDNPGRWMLHCHIAEHMESGMMMTFEVEKR